MTPEVNDREREIILHDLGSPDELVLLWQRIYSIQASPVDAWAGVVSAVLRDPAVLFY